MIPAVPRYPWFRQPDEDIEEHDAPAMSQQDHDLILRYAILGIFVLMTMGALWFSATIAVPVAAGIIFGLVLGPVVDRLMRLGLPQGLAAAVVVLTGILTLVLLLGMFAAPLAIWNDELPAITKTLQARLAELSSFARQFEGLTEGLGRVSSVPVVAVENTTQWVTIALSSTAAAGGILIFLATIYFYLATRRFMKARMLRMCFGTAARRSAGQFLGDLEQKVAAYFGVVTLINLGVGLGMTTIAWAAGLPLPPIWGLLAFLLNYIPFIGPALMTVLIAGAALMGENWSLFSLWPALAFFGMQLVEANLVTPLMIGRRLTLSPFLVFLSFVFWVWLWGPVGAFLATPILLVVTLGFEAASNFRKLEREKAEAEAAEASVAPTTTPNVAAAPSPKAA